MTDQDSSYRPRSPDFSSLPSVLPASDPAAAAPPLTLTSPVAHRASYDASPFFTTPPSRIPQQYVPPGSPEDVASSSSYSSEMARRSARVARVADPEPTVPMPVAVAPEAAAPFVEPPMLPEEPIKQSPAAGIEVKTKFPVARIKRIMQADEDVGKVAQVTPIAVSKALELFMIQLVTKAAKEAKDRNSKRVTALHLKQAVAKDEVLDFLADIIAKVPDQPAGGRKHEDDGSDHNEPKRKRGGRRPKDDSD
ncbi:hypothetical protein ASPZODRAFT_142050 [Penicilliopsis zonata CBS 506.65]|uniref:NCT transcriptional regulatory complex subunit A n=1 Tax=Penicilliopsis zonata CBS 506.65 TaxID=1073090 RepID=A0A1L9SJD1_9EURO|nr:hypothetical protein ASPZODRAFT_142050 [Penicilliopsis zonata CBS 506.65]OJJ47308.1 hypothetical protein ASPZODRAFT_142050 [Penicilliopsis zonata CBS 506.65]